LSRAAGRAAPGNSTAARAPSPPSPSHNPSVCRDFASFALLGMPFAIRPGP